MTKTILLISGLFLFTIQSVHAQKLQVKSTLIVGGPHSYSNVAVQKVVPTADKGLFYSGYAADTGGSISPPCGFSTLTLRPYAGKIDSNGNSVWRRLYCDDNPQPAANCPDGGGYVTWFREGDLNCRRLDCEGNQLWSKNWGSSLGDATMDIIPTSDKGFLICGWSIGSNGDIPFNYAPWQPFMPADWILIKTDSVGNKQWLKVFGSTGDEGIAGVLEINSHYYLIGSSDGRDHDCSDTALYPSPTATGYRLNVLKIDTAGNLVWSKGFGGGGGEYMQAIFDDRDSSIVISDEGPGGMIPFTEPHGQADLRLRKIDLDGNLKWARAYGDNKNEFIGGLCKGPNGGYLFTGYTNWSPNPVYPRYGNDDAWVFWVDSAGNTITQKIIGGPHYEHGRFIVPTKNGYVLSLTYGGFNWDTAQYNIVETGAWLNPYNAWYGALFMTLETWPLGIDNEVHKRFGQLKAWPNPADDQLMIELPETAKQGLITVFAQDGRKVASQKIKNDRKAELDTGGWPPGVYSIVFSSREGKNYSARIVIQHH